MVTVEESPALELLDQLDQPIICEQVDCSHVARWFGITLCCDTTRYGCDAHRIETIHLLSTADRCGHCSVRPHPGIRWVLL